MPVQITGGNAGTKANVDPTGSLSVVDGTNDALIIAPSGARTATFTSLDQTNDRNRGLHIVLNVTAVTATGSITLSIDGKSASGVYYPLLAGVAVTAAGTIVYRIYPGLVAAANLTANDVLPRTWRVVVTPANGVAVTYSVDVSYAR